MSNVIHNPWQQLRSLTNARIALGRAGNSLPTSAHLDFQFAHAQARDAVHLPLNVAALTEQLARFNLPLLSLHSAASDRHQYLQRPDLGRRLDGASVAALKALPKADYDLAIVVADGLSALAVQNHCCGFLQHLLPKLHEADLSLAPISVVEQGRVAVADEVGELLQAKMVVILIGERPGLSSPDSLGLYFTWAPKVGLTDAYRNCISNIRLEGLSYPLASHKLMYLILEASRRQLSGVNLKEQAPIEVLETQGASTPLFLLAQD